MIYRIVSLPSRDRWIACVYPVTSYTTDRAEAVVYHDREMAYQVSEALRSRGFYVIALPATEEDVLDSPDRVGGLKPLLLPSPSPQVAVEGGSLSPMGPALPAEGVTQDGETSDTDTPSLDERVTPLVQPDATTNAVCVVRPTRESITASFIKVMGLDD